MTGKKAVVDESSGEVENVVVADDDFDPGDGRQLVDAADRRVSPGDTYDDAADEFIEQELPDEGTAPVEAFRDARDGGDVQKQLDALFELISGEEP